MRCPCRPHLCTRFYSTKPPPVVLRPYQQTCLQACTEALESGATRIGVSLPTGSGKTTVFITLLSLINPPPESPRATKSLVLVNSVELARQAAAQTEKLFPGWTVEIEQGTKYKASGEADLTVATYQTLLRPARLEKFDPATLKAIIVDEAHHAAAPSYRRILSRFHPAIRSPDQLPAHALTRAIPILGFSATFSRHDGLALGSVFERIVYHRDFLEMIKEQWLCDVRFTAVRANINLSDVTVNSRSGDFNATSLAHVINTPTVNKLVVQSWLDRATDRKSTLVFCVNLAHVGELTTTFRSAGVNAAYIHAGTPAAERKALIASFKAGEFPVLLNCAILTEGADIPNVDCVIVARPTRSRNIFAQMIGRGMRLSPETGKKDCHIIDFVDSTNRVPGIVSVPTLFGLDPSEVIDEETIESLDARAQRVLELDELESGPDSTDDVPSPTSVTYTDYDDPFSLVEQSHGAPHIVQLSPYAWVGCGGDVYVLECMGKGYIRVQPAEDEENPEARYTAHFTPPTLPARTAMMLKISPFQKTRHILTATNLADAIRGGDYYAKTKVVKGPIVAGLFRTAKWRRTPATDFQRKFVASRFAKKDGTGLVPDLSKLTKGEAANIINRLKHGAMSRHQKKAKAQEKQIALAEKERQRKAREHVAVGPLSVA
ncbi:hypothetical protein PHLGIDRAFT_83369 [Phlebiopsis gigantea 11061_1 CR5-6]|uniref:P-loop containing nucleoside triphosphate hydrolase protein n=1 Tax=Phlebiopsis gigantea (strain 11061_1 CR5-6) TaxID=745531 RepID=A0A0C3SD03_PHLG1|nr:hypothetical protein PHLGIDRAFT_83369 [Phlebiopsis gigantea 11061_1 CR5-6]